MARTDPGLGPKAASDAEQSGARPAPKASVDEPSVQIAEPPPRTGGADTVDAILEGFGDRPERPRVKVERRAGLTPVPSPEPPKIAQKHVSTEPGRRQRGRREMAYLAITGLVLLGVIGFVFWVTRERPTTAPAPTMIPTAPPAATTAGATTQEIPPLPTVEATALPTTEPPAVAPAPTARTTVPKATAKPTAATAAPPPASATIPAPTPVPKATGSAPPGFNLLKDKASALE